MTAPPTDPLFAIDDLRVAFSGRRGTVEAVRGVSLRVEPGRTLGLVGESGSGKSVTMLAALGLVGPPGRTRGGTVRWREEVIPAPDRRGLARLRGGRVGFVFQDPMTALNPLMSVGAQVAEAAELHLGLSRRDALGRARELLARVQVSDPDRRLGQMPHALSGGMRQRVMIAAALAGRPTLLVADEPTTALDVTIQAQVLQLLRELQAEMALALILVSHDLGVIAAACDAVAVMYAGRIVESGPAREVFARPAHPYMAGLLRATPQEAAAGEHRARLVAVPGAPPDLAARPDGCSFAPRCPLADERCVAVDPPLESVGPGRRAACWRAFEPAWREAA